MDSLFFLSPEPRSIFLHRVASIIGCAYICLWSYVHYPSNYLISIDAWHDERHSRRLFDLYRATFCCLDSRCVPGLAFEGGLLYLELDLEDSNSLNLVSVQVQRQFYQEAGIKKAVFMGCTNGVIELGMPNYSIIDEQMIKQLFNNDDLAGIPSPPSFRSLSVGSPEYPSNIPTINAISPLHNANTVDEAMMRAMLSVLSSNNNASSSSSPPLRAFEPYNASLNVPIVEHRRRMLGGHNMMKMSISILRSLNMMIEGARIHGIARPIPPSPSSTSGNQLQHMISERKRREKINDSFVALRSLLPPGSKKDKASVLLNTRTYLNTLKSQISELEEKNSILEKQLLSAATEETKEEDQTSNEEIEVEITRAPESTSQTQRITLRVIVRVECEMTDLLLRVLECLKEFGFVSLVSMNAETNSPQVGVLTRLNLNLQVQVNDWDEQSFKEAVMRAIESVVVAQSEATNQQRGV